MPNVPGKVFIRGNAQAKGQKPVGLFETNLVVALLFSFFIASSFPFDHNVAKTFNGDNKEEVVVVEGVAEEIELSKASTIV